MCNIFHGQRHSLTEQPLLSQKPAVNQSLHTNATKTPAPYQRSGDRRSDRGHRLELAAGWDVLRDNPRDHSAQTLQEELRPPVHDFAFLPPHSPMLDPFEEAFSAIKHRVKMGLSLRTDELAATDHLPWGLKTVKRQAILLETIMASLDAVIPAKAAA